MSEEELKAIASEIVQGSIDDYNSIYGTQYTENDISEEQIALILLFLLMSWGGWAAVKDIVDTPIEFNYITKTFGDNYQQYKGVNETTRRRIESLTNSDERILALLEEIDINKAKQEIETGRELTPQEVEEVKKKVEVDRKKQIVDGFSSK